MCTELSGRTKTFRKATLPCYMGFWAFGVSHRWKYMILISDKLSTLIQKLVRELWSDNYSPNITQCTDRRWSWYQKLFQNLFVWWIIISLITLSMISMMSIMYICSLFQLHEQDQWSTSHVEENTHHTTPVWSHFSSEKSCLSRSRKQSGNTHDKPFPPIELILWPVHWATELEPLIKGSF